MPDSLRCSLCGQPVVTPDGVVGLCLACTGLEYEGRCQFCGRDIGTGHESGCPYHLPPAPRSTLVARLAAENRKLRAACGGLVEEGQGVVEQADAVVADNLRLRQELDHAEARKGEWRQRCLRAKADLETTAAERDALRRGLETTAAELTRLWTLLG